MGRNRESRVVFIVKICKGKPSPACNPQTHWRRYYVRLLLFDTLGLGREVGYLRPVFGDRESDIYEVGGKGSHEMAFDGDDMGERVFTRPVYP